MSGNCRAACRSSWAAESPNEGQEPPDDLDPCRCLALHGCRTRCAGLGAGSATPIVRARAEGLGLATGLASARGPKPGGWRYTGRSRSVPIPAFQGPPSVPSPPIFYFSRQKIPDPIPSHIKRTTREWAPEHQRSCDRGPNAELSVNCTSIDIQRAASP